MVFRRLRRISYFFVCYRVAKKPGIAWKTLELEKLKKKLE